MYKSKWSSTFWQSLYSHYKKCFNIETLTVKEVRGHQSNDPIQTNCWVTWSNISLGDLPKIITACSSGTAKHIFLTFSTSTPWHLKKVHSLPAVSKPHTCTACFQQTVQHTRWKTCVQVELQQAQAGTQLINPTFEKLLHKPCWLSPFTHLSMSVCFPTFTSPSLSLCLLSVFLCDHLTPGQQGSSFLAVCLLLLSSFTSRLDHQPCKEDLWLEQAEWYLLSPWDSLGSPVHLQPTSQLHKV